MQVKYDKKLIYAVSAVLLMFVAAVCYVLLNVKPKAPERPTPPQKTMQDVYNSYGPSDDESLKKKPEIVLPKEVLDTYGSDGASAPDPKKEVVIPKEILDSYGTNK